MKSNATILIAGAGGFGSEVEGWLHGKGVMIQNWLDDVDPACVDIDDYEPKEGEQVLVAIGDPKGRESVVNRLRNRGAVFHGMLFNMSPSTARIGGGCIMCPYSIVSAHANVGDFVHVNVHAAIGHHVTVGDYCTLSSFVDLCGHVTVGKRVFFGSGARVMPHVKIGDDAIIGAGAVVVSDVAPGKTVYAPPGRVL